MSTTIETFEAAKKEIIEKIKAVTADQVLVCDDEFGFGEYEPIAEDVLESEKAELIRLIEENDQFVPANSPIANALTGGMQEMKMSENGKYIAKVAAGLDPMDSLLDA